VVTWFLPIAGWLPDIKPAFSGKAIKHTIAKKKLPMAKHFPFPDQHEKRDQ
jgi:hypothetical protein